MPLQPAEITTRQKSITISIVRKKKPSHAKCARGQTTRQMEFDVLHLLLKNEHSISPIPNEITKFSSSINKYLLIDLAMLGLSGGSWDHGSLVAVCKLLFVARGF